LIADCFRCCKQSFKTGGVVKLKRELMIRRIKEGCMEAYIEKHNNYWPELKKEMLEGGLKISPAL